MIKKVFRVALISAFSLSVLTACKKDKDADPATDTKTETNSGGSSSGCDADFSSKVATGKVHGTSFTVAEGTASTNSFRKEEYRVTLYRAKNSDESVIFGVPKETGTYAITSSRSVTFSKSIANGQIIEAATCGEIEITSITKGQISGKIVTHADANNTLNGTFSVSIEERK